MKNVYVMMAEGFEEMELTVPVDCMRRAGLHVHLVGVTGMRVTGAHGIEMAAETPGEGFTLPADADMVFLPGGGPGTEQLKASNMVAEALREASRRGILISAICAAPTVLHKHGLLDGKRATAFPSVQSQLTGSDVTGGAVEVDGKIITGRSAGVALQFAHALITALLSKDRADEVLANLYP